MLFGKAFTNSQHHVINEACSQGRWEPGREPSLVALPQFSAASHAPSWDPLDKGPHALRLAEEGHQALGRETSHPSFLPSAPLEDVRFDTTPPPEA